MMRWTSTSGENGLETLRVPGAHEKPESVTSRQPAPARVTGGCSYFQALLFAHPALGTRLSVKWD